jgi:hypothetical protein
LDENPLVKSAHFVRITITVSPDGARALPRWFRQTCHCAYFISWIAPLKSVYYAKPLANPYGCGV